MTRWCSAPWSLAMPHRGVHVWRARLDAGEAEIATRYAVLDEAERERAAGYHLERDRRHFTVARGVTRAVLAAYSGAAPQALRFCLGVHGKPALLGPEEPPLRFNVSHSGDVVLVAVSDVDVGVDVERVRGDIDVLELARHSFSKAENEALRALAPSQQRAAFFACWTRKEAYIKAIGLGLAMPLGDFSVSLAPGAPPALLEVAADPGEAAGWTLESFDAGADHPCALAFRAHGFGVDFFDVESDQSKRSTTR